MGTTAHSATSLCSINARSISAGESAAGKVSPAVERYIAAHHLYGDNR